MKHVLFLAGAMWVACGSQALAVEFDRGPLRLELRAHARSLLTFTRQERFESILSGSTSRSDSALWLNRLRLEAEARWGDRWSAELAYDNEVFSGSALRSLQFEVGQELGEGTWLDADRWVSQHSDAEWRHLLYRAWLRYEGERLEVTLGRQRIALGRGRLWNPTDLFNPIPPLAIEGGQRIGQDALAARVRLTPSLWGAFIWSPQDDPDDHRGALRLEWSDPSFDAAVMVARIERDWVVGADVASNFRGAAVRLEATFADEQRGGRIWQVVASADYTWSVGTGLYTLVEHFYNENLTETPRREQLLTVSGPDTAARELARRFSAPVSRLTSRVRNQTGVQIGYDLTPLLRADLLWLHDWSGPSEAFVPSLSWSPRSDLELSAGVQLFWGDDDDSEFGGATNLFILQLNLYF